MALENRVTVLMELWSLVTLGMYQIEPGPVIGSLSLIHVGMLFGFVLFLFLCLLSVEGLSFIVLKSELLYQTTSTFCESELTISTQFIFNL